MGWILVEVKNLSWIGKISRTFRGLMVLELVIFTYQASLSKMSHINNQTPLDAALFGLKGLLPRLILWL